MSQPYDMGPDPGVRGVGLAYPKMTEMVTETGRASLLILVREMRLAHVCVEWCKWSYIFELEPGMRCSPVPSFVPETATSQPAHYDPLLVQAAAHCKHNGCFNSHRYAPTIPA